MFAPLLLAVREGKDWSVLFIEAVFVLIAERSAVLKAPAVPLNLLLSAKQSVGVVTNAREIGGLCLRERSG